MYQLSTATATRSPCKNYHLLLLQPNHWKHGGNPGRPPTQGQDSTTAVQPFRNFSPNFLSLLFLTFFYGYTGHWSPCPVPLTTFPQPFFLLIRSWTSWPTNHYPPPRALLCSQHGPHPSGAPDREPVVLLSLPSCELLCACALCFCVLVCDMSFIHVVKGALCMSMCFSMLLSMLCASCAQCTLCTPRKSKEAQN